MTESQKALSQFIAFINKHAPNKVDEISSATSEMKKLVDKATPKKPTFVESYPSGECPNCDESIGGRNYCHNCGQALDWSENDWVRNYKHHSNSNAYNHD